MSSTLLIPSDVPVLFIFFFISFVVKFGADKSFNTMSIILLFEYRNGKKIKGMYTIISLKLSLILSVSSREEEMSGLLERRGRQAKP